MPLNGQKGRWQRSKRGGGNGQKGVGHGEADRPRRARRGTALGARARSGSTASTGPPPTCGAAPVHRRSLDGQQGVGHWVQRSRPNPPARPHERTRWLCAPRPARPAQRRPGCPAGLVSGFGGRTHRRQLARVQATDVNSDGLDIRLCLAESGRRVRDAQDAKSRTSRHRLDHMRFACHRRLHLRRAPSASGQQQRE